MGSSVGVVVMCVCGLGSSYGVWYCVCDLSSIGGGWWCMNAVVVVIVSRW